MTDLAALVAVAEELGLLLTAKRDAPDRWSLWLWKSDDCDPLIVIRDGAELTLDREPHGARHATLPEIEAALRKWAGGEA